jgi:transposase
MTWQPKHLTREQKAERRVEGVRLLQSTEMTQAQIARELRVSEAVVSRWKKELEQHGAEALRARRITGRPAKLAEGARQALLKKLEEGAVAAGFPTEQWTQDRVKQVIEREFGVSYHRLYIGRLLHKLGWSVQKPDPRALERDENLIRAWLRQDWPRIKKSAAHRRRNRV